VLAVTLLVAFVLFSFYYPPVAWVFGVAAVIVWYAKAQLADLETRRMTEGNHSIFAFSVYDDVVAKELVRIIDSCEISVAVNSVRTREGAVFGFGNTKYAAEFKQLNSAAEYV